ncbi:MAG: hypothetical protein JRI23_26140 [Deltaproteobacteria bacterium]|jgi:hypothetical protein|nr:hypothetical protein [Deltaproteobacteria bacterium]MBW2535514.1 hypothetical protein [Deltaproteobacteria bacterium]
MRAVPALVLGLALPAMAISGGTGCSEDNPLCCGEGDFQVGGTINVEGQAGVAMQAVADFAAIASASIDDLTAACRSISEDLDVDPAERQAAEQTSDKRARMEAYCELAVSAIGSFKAQAGGSLTVNFDPPVCEASISAKADCQASCSGSASCDLEANPPTCEGGKLEVACKGGCTASGSASVSCEGSCSGECSGSCTAEGGVECQGKCEGTCSASAQGSGTGIQADGTCDGVCEGTCEVTAPSASCSGTCNGSCSATCQGSAEASVKCDGECDADYEPLKCSGGELKGGCEVEAKCEANCDASVKAKAECKPPQITVEFSGSADVEAAGKLKLALEASLGLVAALEARLDAMASIATTFSGSVDADVLAEIKAACIPVVINAVGVAVADVGASFEATVSIMGSVSS